jgi:hypothetical protein
MLHRRTCFQSLWQLSEAVKFGLARGKPTKLKELNPTLIGKDTSSLFAAILKPLAPQVQMQFLLQVGELTVLPWEIDALVREPVEATMKKCNKLILKHLMGNPSEEHTVDRVVISGNGAQYPLIRRRAEEMLSIPEAKDCITLDKDNLKNAVAKGAALARMVERVPRTLGIKFNRHLSELLPFDIGYHNMITNTYELLFSEYSPYAQLAEAKKKVRLITPGGSAGTLGNSTFVLERKFPGDENYEQYAAYRFPMGISGELEVSYDAALGEFQVMDLGSGQLGELKDLTEKDNATLAASGTI